MSARTLTSKQRWFLLLLVASLAGSGWSLSRVSAAAQESPPTSRPAGGKQDQAQTIYRARVNLVNVVFSVTDRRRRFVKDLTRGDFQVFEDGKPQEIQYFSNFSKTGDVPLTIALLVDTSGSVKDKLQLEIDTATQFLRRILRPSKDLALLMQFSSEVELVRDFTDSVERLEASLDTLRAGGGTALYDAIFLAATEKLKQEAGRKVIVVLSDGEDNQSRVKKQEAIRAAQSSDILIYGIGVRGVFRADFGVLKDFAKETGGRFFKAKARMRELESAFKAINEDLMNQYGLAYSPTNQLQDGTFRKIVVRCKRKSLRVKARSGYYAPKEETLRTP